MPYKKVIAMSGVGLLLAACTSTHFYPSARVGSVPPAYPVGHELSSGIIVIDRIPVEKLATSGTVALDKNDPCRSIPSTVVTPAGFPGEPVESSQFGCDWISSMSGITLRVAGFPLGDMAKQVTGHIDTANGRAPPDSLAHLAWLLIDGHYVIERILKNDPSSGCFLTLDLGSPSVAFVIVYATDPIGQKPAVARVEDSVAEFCPRARTVAQNLLRHLLGTR